MWLRAIVATSLLLWSGSAAAEARAAKATAADENAYNGPPTLLRREPRLGAYVGPSLAFSRIALRAGMLLGLEGGLSFDHQFSLGVAGYLWGSETHGPVTVDGTPQNLEVMYGGITVRHAFLTRYLVYPSVGAVVGAGAGTLVADEGEVRRSDVDTFFVLEPQVCLASNLTRWMRVALYAGYRMTAGVSRFSYSSADYRAPTLGGTIQFGSL